MLPEARNGGKAHWATSNLRAPSDLPATSAIVRVHPVLQFLRS